MAGPLIHGLSIAGVDNFHYSLEMKKLATFQLRRAPWAWMGLIQRPVCVQRMKNCRIHFLA
jgi:hypothetical protein